MTLICAALLLLSELSAPTGASQSATAQKQASASLIDQVRALPPFPQAAGTDSELWDAVLARARQTPASALPLLVETLTDPDQRTADNAGVLLSLLAGGETFRMLVGGDTALPARRAARLDMLQVLPLLLRTLESQSRAARARSALVISTIGPRASAAAGPLTRLVADETDTRDNRRTLAMALGAIGPAAKEAIPALQRLYLELPAVHQRDVAKALKSIGGREALPSTPPPRGIRLLPGWSHATEEGVDTLVGRIWRKDGLEISYEIGDFGRGHAIDPERARAWTLKQAIGGESMHVTLRPDRTLDVLFERDTASFSVGPIRTQRDLAEVLLMLATSTAHGGGLSGFYMDPFDSDSNSGSGLEVTMTFAKEAYHAVVQVNGPGGPSVPVVVPASVDFGKGTIEFALDSSRRLSGTFGPEGIEGTFAGKPIILRRSSGR